MDKLSYQQIYGILQLEMSKLFYDWPVPMPPRLQILHTAAPDAVHNDPRGDKVIMLMHTEAITYGSSGVPLATPTDNVVRVYHPTLEAMIKNGYNSRMSFSSGLIEIFSDMLHEMFHYISAVRAYMRALRHSADDDALLAVDLYANHVSSFLGSNLNEYRNEQYTIRALLAWSFERDPISIEDVYNDSLVLPNPGGPFYQSVLTKASGSLYAELLHIAYRYHYIEAAFGPKEKRGYHTKMIKTRAKEIQALAKTTKESYGETWRLWDDSND